MLPCISKYPIKKDKPWLVLGKGPTFSKVWEIDRKAFYVFGLNHSCHLFDVDVCHAVDLDGLFFDKLSQIQTLILPFHPHLSFRASNKTLTELLNQYPHISELAAVGKLYTYNLSTYKARPDHRYAQISARYFSSEAAFNILSTLGIKEIYSLGIDGGTKYAEEFYDIGLKPLTNGRKTFDDGIRELNNICLARKVSWTRL
jgi:hypothetical protein